MNEKDLLKIDLIKAVETRQPANKIKAILKKLAQRRVPIDAVKDKSGLPVLNMAVESVKHDNSDTNTYSISVVRLLLRYGANPLLTDKDGDTLLHLAARGLCAETAECLIFACADPMALNKKKQTCSQVAPQKSNMMRSILRKTRVNDKSAPIYIVSEQTSPYRSRTGHFSIELGGEVTDGSNSVVPTAIMIRTKAPGNLDPAIPRDDGEIFWGHGMEYWSSVQTQAKITFFLHDRVDTFHRLVIRMKTNEKQAKEYSASVEDFLPREEVTAHNGPYVAMAKAHVQLDKSGSISLVYGLASDEIQLGPEGGSFEFSKNPAVKLKASCENGGRIPEGVKLNLQVKTAPPLETSKPLEPASEEAAEATATRQPALVAMTPFVSVKGAPALADSHGVTLRTTLPLNEQFTREGPPLVVYARNDEESSQDGDNLNEESGRWSLVAQNTTINRSASSVSLQTSINRTTTVVQSAAGADPQEVKRAIAEQHIKSRQVPVRFHVFDSPCQPTENGEAHSPGECCLKIEVKSKREDSSSAETHSQPGGFRLIKVSDVFYVTHSLQIRISLDQSFVVIVFQHGVHTDNVGNSCAFPVSKDGSTYRKIMFKVEKSQMVTKIDEHFKWKPLTDLEVSVPPVTAAGSPDPPLYTSAGASPETPRGAGDSSDVDAETDEDPVNDQLLMDLAFRIPISSVYRVGVELGLDSRQVENIIHSSDGHEEMITKCFKILRSAKYSYPSSKEFVQSLYKTLKQENLNEQLQWLARKLRNYQGYEPRWDHFTRLPNINSP